MMSRRVRFIASTKPFGREDFERESWAFVYLEHEHALVVTEYVVEERKSLQDAWRPTVAFMWGGTSLSGGANGFVLMISHEKVPLNAHIVEMARRRFLIDMRVICESKDSIQAKRKDF